MISWVYMGFSLSLVVILISLFVVSGKKNSWDPLVASEFECGFTPYYFSRFSFSIHYFVVALIFLLLDLELCFLFPFFLEEMFTYHNMVFIFFFVTALLLGLIKEWAEGYLEWKS